MNQKTPLLKDVETFETTSGQSFPSQVAETQRTCTITPLLPGTRETKDVLVGSNYRGGQGTFG